MTPANEPSVDQTVTFSITKVERHFIAAGLRAQKAKFAHEIADRLDQTRCTFCRGSGYAPYVGGEDDDAPCLRCGGSGHAS